MRDKNKSTNSRADLFAYSAVEGVGWEDEKWNLFQYYKCRTMMSTAQKYYKWLQVYVCHAHSRFWVYARSIARYTLCCILEFKSSRSIEMKLHDSDKMHTVDFALTHSPVSNMLPAIEWLHWLTARCIWKRSIGVRRINSQTDSQLKDEIGGFRAHGEGVCGYRKHDQHSTVFPSVGVVCLCT